MDAIERGVDADVFRPHLFGDILNKRSHLDGCPSVDLHLDFLPRFVLVEQLSEVGVVVLQRSLLRLLFLLLLEVLRIFVLAVLLVDGRLALLLALEVAASRLLAVDHHHLVVGREGASGEGGEVLAEDLVESVAVDWAVDVLQFIPVLLGLHGDLVSPLGVLTHQSLQLLDLLHLVLVLGFDQRLLLKVGFGRDALVFQQLLQQLQVGLQLLVGCVLAQLQGIRPLCSVVRAVGMQLVDHLDGGNLVGVQSAVQKQHAFLKLLVALAEHYGVQRFLLLRSQHPAPPPLDELDLAHHVHLHHLHLLLVEGNTVFLLHFRFLINVFLSAASLGSNAVAFLLNHFLLFQL
jgi:hypothetical protein